MQIESDLLIIRPFKKTDIKAFHQLAKNQTAIRFIHWGPLDYQQSEQYIQRAIKLLKVKQPRKFIFAVTLKDGTFIGTVYLHVRNHIHRLAEISYLLDPAYWGKGLGSEAVQTILKWAFGQLKMHRIVARADRANTNSTNLLRRNHFNEEGVMREDFLFKGKWRDSVLYSLLEDEFKLNQS